jgi:hypothetical protein
MCQPWSVSLVLLNSWVSLFYFFKFPTYAPILCEPQNVEPLMNIVVSCPIELLKAHLDCLSSKREIWEVDVDANEINLVQGCMWE